MDKILRGLSLCDIVMADIQATTLDQRVHELFEIYGELVSGKGGVFK